MRVEVVLLCRLKKSETKILKNEKNKKNENQKIKLCALLVQLGCVYEKTDFFMFAHYFFNAHYF